MHGISTWMLSLSAAMSEFLRCCRGEMCRLVAHCHQGSNRRHNSTDKRDSTRGPKLAFARVSRFRLLVLFARGTWVDRQQQPQQPVHDGEEKRAIDAGPIHGRAQQAGTFCSVPRCSPDLLCVNNPDGPSEGHCEKI